ncbi:MAG: hypothetical protein AB8F95_18610 [Bacteroidia bacterium]
MKRLCVIAPLLLCCILHAQKPPVLDQSRRHEIGIAVQDIVDFFEEGLHLNYRYHLKRGALRLNLGASYSSTFTQGREFDFLQNIKNQRFELGIEKHYWLGKQWMFYLGAGVKLEEYEKKQYDFFDEDRTRSADRTRVSSTVTIGPSVYSGFRFQISPRVSLGTEFNFTYGMNLNYTYHDNPAAAIELATRSTTAMLDFSYPRLIYVQMTL